MVNRDVIKCIQIMLNDDAEKVQPMANGFGEGCSYYQGYIAHCRDFSAKLEKFAETFPPNEINIVPEIALLTIETLSKALEARDNDNEEI